MPIVAPRRILIFAEDPRLCRLLLREARAAGFEGVATTEPDKLAERCRISAPDILLMEIDRLLGNVKPVLELLGGCQGGRLVLISGVNAVQLGEVIKLANQLGISIGGILNKPMGIEAIRAVFGRQRGLSSSLQARPAMQGAAYEYEQSTR